MEKYYRFADHNFLIKPVFETFFKFAKEYEIKPCSNYIKIDNNIEEIQNWSSDHSDGDYPMEYIETLVVHSKIADKLAKDNCFIFHGSSIYVDSLNNAFIFTAPSGTGKSTHTKILTKIYHNRVRYINDDKPFISLIDKHIYVYGSPWDGKSRISNNVKALLKGIFIINRSPTNSVSKISPQESMMILFKQIHLPKGEINTKNGSEILMKIVKEIPVYMLNVNMEDEAGQISMKAIEKIMEGK